MTPTAERANINHNNTPDTSLSAVFISPPESQDLITLSPIQISAGIESAIVILNKVCVILTRRGGV